VDQDLPARFALATLRETIAPYEWKGSISFQFCETCGCAPFAEGRGPNGPMVEINLRCVPEIDLDCLEITRFDRANKL
jgi:hypothetical protein